MAPGTRSKFGVPMFEFEVFRQQMDCIGECSCDIVGSFGRPCSHSTPPVVVRRPGNRAPLAPLVTPLSSSTQAFGFEYARVYLH